MIRARGALRTWQTAGRRWRAASAVYNQSTPARRRAMRDNLQHIAAELSTVHRRVRRAAYAALRAAIRDQGAARRETQMAMSNRARRHATELREAADALVAEAQSYIRETGGGSGMGRLVRDGEEGLGLWDPRTANQTWPEPVIYRSDLRRLYRGDPQMLRNGVRLVPKKTVVEVDGRRRLSMGGLGRHGCAGCGDGALGASWFGTDEEAELQAQQRRRSGRSGVTVHPRDVTSWGCSTEGAVSMLTRSQGRVLVSSLTPASRTAILAVPELGAGYRTVRERCAGRAADPNVQAWATRQRQKQRADNQRAARQAPPASFAREFGEEAGRQAGGLFAGAGKIATAGAGAFLKKTWPYLLGGAALFWLVKGGGARTVYSSAQRRFAA